VKLTYKSVLTAKSSLSNIHNSLHSISVENAAAIEQID